MLHLIVFSVFGLVCVAGAVNLLVQRHPINSALSLVVVMGSLAVEYLLLGAEFVAAVQVIVYAGAIMVLFLFVVTMLASEAADTELPDRIPWQRWVAGILGLTLVGTLSYLLFTGTPIDSGPKATAANSLSHVVNTQGNTEAFGQALFHGFVYPFEVTSLLIIVAVLGAMVLGRKA